MDIRLNKYISDSGFCSRREADRYIEKGKVLLNGKIAAVGDKVRARDKVKVNGNQIEGRDEYVYLALNKPVGVTCTTDTTDPTNIVDFVNYPTRIFNIGRLDKDSEGLILMTDDGDIVNKILRAGNNHEKEYEVTVDRSIADDFVEKMSGGVSIMGDMTRKCKVIKEGDKNFRIILTQGLNRQIRRMCESFGYNVVKLKRVRVMHIKLDNLPLEQWRALTDKELDILMKSLEKSENIKAKWGASNEERQKAAGSRDADKKKLSSKPRTGSKPSSEGDKMSAGSKPRTSSRPSTGGDKRVSGSKPRTSSRPSSDGDKRGAKKSTTFGKSGSKPQAKTGRPSTRKSASSKPSFSSKPSSSKRSSGTGTRGKGR